MILSDDEDMYTPMTREDWLQHEKVEYVADRFKTGDDPVWETLEAWRKVMYDDAIPQSDKAAAFLAAYTASINKVYDWYVEDMAEEYEEMHTCRQCGGSGGGAGELRCPHCNNGRV